MHGFTKGHGCQIRETAQIGGPPEHRAFKAGDMAHPPILGDRVKVNAFVTIDAGMERPTTIGDDTFLLTKSHVGHDAIIGDRVELATGAVVCGHCVIEDNVKIGVNATILPYRRIGRGARIGSGAVVTKDVRPGVTVAGNPARELDPSDRDPRPYTERVADVQQLEDAA